METRKLAHFRKAGNGDPMWSGKCVYGLDGQSPSFSEYDAHDPYGDIPDGLEYKVAAGIVVSRQMRLVKEPTLTRDSRIAAHFDSAPAARVFQGFGNVRWSGLLEGFGLAPRPLIRPRPLHVNANPNQVGAKELHRSTQYQPFPAMGSIVGSFGEGKAL